MPLVRRSAFAVAALAAAGAIVTSGGSSGPAAATTPPVVAQAGTIAIPTGYVDALAAAPDGTLRVTNWGRKLTVSTITTGGVLQPPIALTPAGADIARAALPGDDAIAVYDAKAVDGASGTTPAFVARTLAGSGETREESLGTGLNVNEVEGGAGSVAVEGLTQVGARRYRPMLQYRAAGSTAFSPPVSLGRGSDDTYDFAFAADGTAAVLTRHSLLSPHRPAVTVHRIRRDGTVGAEIPVGPRNSELLQLASVFTPKGDLVVAELIPVTPSSDRMALLISTLRAGADRFTTPRRIDVVGLTYDLALAATSDGTVTALVTEGRQARIYEGPPASLRRTKTFASPQALGGQLVATGDGGVAAYWGAGRSATSKTLDLTATVRHPGGPWIKPAVFASGVSWGNDSSGGGLGVEPMAATALPGGGFAVAYWEWHRRKLSAFVQRIVQ